MGTRATPGVSPTPRTITITHAWAVDEPGMSLGDPWANTPASASGRREEEDVSQVRDFSARFHPKQFLSRDPSRVTFCERPPSMLWRARVKLSKLKGRNSQRRARQNGAVDF